MSIDTWHELYCETTLYASAFAKELSSGGSPHPRLISSVSVNARTEALDLISNMRQRK